LRPKRKTGRRFLILKREGVEVQIRCIEESLVNFWGASRDGKIQRFPKENWEVVRDEVKI